MSKDNVKIGSGIEAFGVEDEYLITDLLGNIPSFEQVACLFASLASIGCKQIKPFQYQRGNVVIEQDSGYALIEFIYPPHKVSDQHEFLRERRQIIVEVFELFGKFGYTLLASCSPQPISESCLYDYASHKPRTRAFIQLQPQTQHYRFFGPALHLHQSFATEQELVESFNLINQLSGLWLLLTARQKLWLGQVSRHQSAREYSWHLNGAIDLGDHERFLFFPFLVNCSEDYFGFVSNKPVLFWEQDGELIVLRESLSFNELQTPHLVTDKIDGRKVELCLSEEDFSKFLGTFWYGVRLKRYGRDTAMETRVFDMQDLETSEHLIRLFTHILAHRDVFCAFVNRYGFDYWRDFYWQALTDGCRGFVQQNILADFLKLITSTGFPLPPVFTDIAATGQTQSDYLCALFNSDDSSLMSSLAVL